MAVDPDPIDVQLAFPLVVLIIAIVAVLGPSFVNLVICPRPGRLGAVRPPRPGTVLSLREKEFVESARALGADPIWIMGVHLLPNTMTSIVIYLTFDIARLLLLESSLAFLGLGVQPPTPSWGAMISDGRQYLFEAWWDAALPGAMIIMAVLAFNFVGDGLRDALDPLSRQQHQRPRALSFSEPAGGRHQAWAAILGPGPASNPTPRGGSSTRRRRRSIHV